MESIASRLSPMCGVLHGFLEILSGCDSLKTTQAGGQGKWENHVGAIWLFIHHYNASLPV